jgi:nicotinate-nucleotide pyrophosphorylase (carboxylating)
VLAAERCLLNFLMRLCGVAHNAHVAVAAVPPGTAARIYDTRKTMPGWRLLDKAAVRTGGACNHRKGLFDAILIKDNHVQAAGSVGAAVQRARSRQPTLVIEVEIDRLEQLEEAIAAGADLVLLDNFDPPTMRQAVELSAGRVALEASGGITLAQVDVVARTGVQRISMGSLTHSVIPADLSLELFD